MWIVSQIGAREHYAIPRALHQTGQLGAVITDFWVKPDSLLTHVPGGRGLKGRYHQDLADVEVFAPNQRMLAFEMVSRVRKKNAWELIEARNAFFQRQALIRLRSWVGESVTLFSYSYAALELFRFAKAQGWQTVLGQIDPGPEEERIVMEEHRRYPGLASSWEPAPSSYWDSWREELALADRIIVNSEWSRQCLNQEGVSEQKMEIVPLVYDEKSGVKQRCSSKNDSALQVLFLGAINLRKGVGRLLDAMRILKSEAIELVLAGPTEIDPSAWGDLPKVKWIGPVARSAVGEVYQEADVFILPTLSDGYALTQLEALANGVPVIASRHCGAAVRDGENGWILDDVEPESLAQCLRGILNKQELKTPSSQSFELSDLGGKLIRNGEGAK